MGFEEGGQGSTDVLHIALNNLWWMLPGLWMLPNATTGKISCGHRTSYIASASLISASGILLLHEQSLEALGLCEDS